MDKLCEKDSAENFESCHCGGAACVQFYVLVYCTCSSLNVAVTFPSLNSNTLLHSPLFPLYYLENKPS